MLLALLLTLSSSLPGELDGGLEPAPGHLAAPLASPDAGAPAAQPAGPKRSLRGAAEASLGLLPSGAPQNGLDFFGTLHASIGFSVDDVFELALGPTLRFRLIDTPAFNRATDVGEVLRGADWDELSDFGHLLQALRIGREGGVFQLKAGPARKKQLGLGHLLWRYSNQANVDSRPASAEAVLHAGPVRLEVFASDVLGARLFAGEVAWDLGGTFSGSPLVKDRYVLAFQVAHDFNLAARPFLLDPAATRLTLAPNTLLHVDGSAVLARSPGLRWMVMLGTGTRANETADLGFLVGTTLDATVAEIGFSVRVELRKQAGGFRHGFFGPMYELQRFSDLGLREASIGEARLPDGFSSFGELRVGIGQRLTFDLAAEYFFWNRLDLDGGLSLALLDDWLFLTARTTMLGLAQQPRFAFHGGLRWRLFPSFYVLGEGGTVFFPQPDGSLIRGVGFSAGAGVDFER